MKFKAWKIEFEFSEKDTEVAIPLVIFFASCYFTSFDKNLLVTILLIYFILYLYLKKVLLIIKRVSSSLQKWRKLRCPNCKSTKIHIGGYRSISPDEVISVYSCASCGIISIMTEGGLAQDK